MRHRIRSRRCGLVAASGFISSVAATQALASLPIAFGPGSANATLGSLTFPTYVHRVQSISWSGTTLFEETLGTASGAQLRAIELTPDGNHVTLPTITGGSGKSDEIAISSDGYITTDVYITSDGTSAGAFRGIRAVRFSPGSSTAVALAVPSNATDSNGIVSTTATSINRGGTIGGQAEVYSANGSEDLGTRGVVWSAAGVASYRSPSTYQTTSDGQNFGSSSVAVINDAGVAGGTAERYNSAGQALGTRPVRWAPNASVGAELVVPTTDSTGGAGGEVDALNNAGTAWGTVQQYSSNGTFLGFRPARWDAGTTAITPLGMSGNDINGNTGTVTVRDANDAGTAVGSLSAYTNTFANLGVRAVRWNAGSTASTLLGTLFTGTATSDSQAVSAAYTINALGTIAGFSLNADGSAKRAVLWLPGSTTPLDLTPLVTTGNANIQSLDEADGVSDTGWVSGIATYGSTKYKRAFTMLVPQAGTYGKGDANFDTVVNFDDLVILAQNYNKANTSLATNVGDFNFDGQTNFDDLVILAQNYNKSPGAGFLIGNASFAADWVLAQSLVPEPATLGALALLPLLCRRRV